jgi:flagellar hook protein FlgE
LKVAGAGGVLGAQVGSGVSTAGITNQFTQGSLSRTGVQTDLGVSGDGFFVVRDAVSGAQFVTRAGDFRFDDQGYLVTNKGLRVQGYTDPGLSSRGDVKMDGTGRPADVDPNATVLGYTIDPQGRVSMKLSDGKEYVRSQILLQNFRDPQALSKEGDNLYSTNAAAGAFDAPVDPGTNGVGKVISGALELSNVDLTQEFSSLITTQRGFQASARIVTTSDEMLQELVNLKR